jgi:manganese efflux pump family protein
MKDRRYSAAVIVAAILTAIVWVCVLRIAPGVTATIELKILAIAFAVGLDVLALSIAIGIMQLPWSSRIRLGASFCAAEVIMQIIGYGIGTGAGHVIGTIADYVGFAILAAVGVFVVRESFGKEDVTFKVDSGWGLILASASISLDSLGIGVSLPGVPLPLLPLLATVAVSTVIFTTVGLTFGAQLGSRYRQLAERVAGFVLIALAVFFTAQHIFGWVG